MLGIGERTFRRWRDRFEEEGDAGLADRRLGRPSQKRAPAIEIERMLGLFRDKYADFTVKHFHEQLRKRHDYKLGYTVTKVHLHRARLVRPPVTRPAHRKKRPSRPFCARLGADVVCYTFTVADSHHLLLADLPAHPRP